MGMTLHEGGDRGAGRLGRWGAALCVAMLATGVAQAEPVAPGLPEAVSAGRAIYLQGMLPSGAPLMGRREGSTASGSDAACVNCHQRSGMGVAEGGAVVPPVTRVALFEAFRTRGERRLRAAPAGAQALPGERPPYDEAGLARALREGHASDGQPLAYAMPRYVLGERDMHALIAYLRTLDAGPSPGVEDGRIHLATVIAPDVPAARRRIFLDTLNAYIGARHPEPREGQDARRPGWRLHVWQLEGPAEGWEAQLRARHAERPVFAVLSGLGGGEWAPVHRFCAEAGVPCLLPNTDVAGAEEESFYSFYFSRGVRLDALVLARHLAEQGAGHRRVVQVSRPYGAGMAAAAAMREALNGTPLRVEDRALPAEGERAAWLVGLGPGDALVLWLAEADVVALLRDGQWPSGGPAVFFSGSLAPPERLPAGEWRAAARFVHALEVPGRLERRIGLGLGPWLARLALRLEDARLQGHTLAACVVLTEALTRLRGVWLRDYLVETIEAGMAAHAAETVLLPRFAFGPGQRFASKGAYLGRYADSRSSLLVIEPGLIVP